jgi:hypothetical protein
MQSTQGLENILTDKPVVICCERMRMATKATLSARKKSKKSFTTGCLCNL